MWSSVTLGSRSCKAMRGRITLQGTTCEINQIRPLFFCVAFGVRTRPRVAFNCNQPLSGTLLMSLGSARPTSRREK
jgi:hypothetical protein